MIKSILGLEILSLKSFITRYTPLHSIPGHGMEDTPTHFRVARLKPSKHSVVDPLAPLYPTSEDYPIVQDQDYTFRIMDTTIPGTDLWGSMNNIRTQLQASADRLLIKGALNDAKEHLNTAESSPFDHKNLQTLLNTLLKQGSYRDDLKLVRIAPKQWTILDISLFQLFFSNYLISYFPHNPVFESMYKLDQPYRLVVMKEHLLPNQILKR